MSRLLTNFLIDVLMFVATAVMSVSGLVIKLILPRRGLMHHGVGAPIDFLGLERFVWRDIHIWSGVALLLLLVLHIVLHWSVISSLFAKYIPNRALRLLIYLLFAIVVLLSLIPWLYVLIL